MRDPVERLWSQVRMLINSQNRPLISGFLDQNQAILYALSQSYMESRSKYEVTIKNIEDNFDQSDIFYSFYEKIFDPDEYKKLDPFLGFKLIRPNSAEKIFCFPKNEELNIHTKFSIAIHYNETNSYCLNKFGKRVLQYWKGYELLSQAYKNRLMVPWTG